MPKPTMLYLSCTFIALIVLFALGEASTRWEMKTPSTCSKSSTVAVFGGTGNLGQECVYQALNANHKVVVLSRDPSKMTFPAGSGGPMAGRPFKHANLKIIKGDVADQTAVDAVFDSADDITGVIVALGGRTKAVGPTMLTDGTKCVVNAMKRKTSAKRIAIATSIGCGDSARQAPLKFKLLMYTVMTSIFKDKNRQEAIFLAKDGEGRELEYCLVRPGQLGTGPATGVVNVIDGTAGSIQRADVASFMLGAITDPSFPYVRKTPCISSVGGTGWVKEKKEGFDGVSKA